MRKKVCNQVLKGSVGTCKVCNEITVLTLPLSVENMIKQLETFTKLHTLKGCNKKEFAT